MEQVKYSLSELQRQIASRLKESFPLAVWLVAEISEISVNRSGHCYMELVERDAGKDSVAKAKAVIWGKQARFILPYFKSSTGFDLDEGHSVLVKVLIEYHPLYGLSLVVTDIDPRHTIGDQVQKRNQVIARLEADGIIAMNHDLPLPLHPARIAVISSAKAAGYGDFTDQLENNPYGYTYRTTLFEAYLQGKETSPSVTAALDRIAAEAENFDLAVIVRGGGSQSDLSWFDDYEIAFMITQFPIPVVSGIGHDRDQTVTDIVAHTACKTPTAAAEFIIARSAEAEAHVLSLGRAIAGKAQSTLFGMKQRVEIAGRLIRSSAYGSVRERYMMLSVMDDRLRKSSAARLTSARERIASFERSFNLLNPYNILKRGYSITYHNGKPINSAGKLKKGDTITTLLQSGKISSEVFDIKD